MCGSLSTLSCQLVAQKAREEATQKEVSAGSGEIYHQIVASSHRFLVTQNEAKELALAEAAQSAFNPKS
jgi:hypothetical protein